MNSKAYVTTMYVLQIQTSYVQYVVNITITFKLNIFY